MPIFFIRVLSGLILAGSVLPLLSCQLTAMTAASLAATSASTSTTSGESWLTDDGLLKAAWKLQVFPAFTRPRLEQEAARADREYPASFAQLTGAPAEQYSAFARSAQEHAATLLDSPSPTQVVRVLTGAQ